VIIKIEEIKIVITVRKNIKYRRLQLDITIIREVNLPLMSKISLEKVIKYELKMIKRWLGSEDEDHI